MKKYTQHYIDKLGQRVDRIMEKFPKKVKRMVYDDDGNMYGATVANAGVGARLNVAYYLILGKKIYIVSYDHDFTRSYGVFFYRNSMFSPKNINERLTVYDPSVELSNIFSPFSIDLGGDGKLKSFVNGVLKLLSLADNF